MHRILLVLIRPTVWSCSTNYFDYQSSRSTALNKTMARIGICCRLVGAIMLNYAFPFCHDINELGASDFVPASLQNMLFEP